jgi:hypothetical protein
MSTDIRDSPSTSDEVIVQFYLSSASICMHCWRRWTLGAWSLDSFIRSHEGREIPQTWRGMQASDARGILIAISDRLPVLGVSYLSPGQATLRNPANQEHLVFDDTSPATTVFWRVFIESHGLGARGQSYHSRV